MKLKEELSMQTEMEELKSIVNKTFSIDILKRCRKRELVDARRVFSKILRERGYTLITIAKYLKKDHSTIINLMISVDTILKTDRMLLEKYIICRDTFLDGREAAFSRIKGRNLFMKVARLETEIEKMLLERENVLILKEKYTRLEKIINLINSRLHAGEEALLERKLYLLLNGKTLQS